MGGIGTPAELGFRLRYRSDLGKKNGESRFKGQDESRRGRKVQWCLVPQGLSNLPPPQGACRGSGALAPTPPALSGQLQPLHVSRVAPQSRGDPPIGPVDGHLCLGGLLLREETDLGLGHRGAPVPGESRDTGIMRGSGDYSSVIGKTVAINPPDTDARLDALASYVAPTTPRPACADVLHASCYWPSSRADLDLSPV